MEEDRVRPASPGKSFDERVNALRRGLQCAVAHARLTAAARGVNVKAIAERCASLPGMDVIGLSASQLEGSRDGVDSLARQAFPVRDVQVAEADAGPALLVEIRRGLDAGNSPLVALCDASAVWEEDAALWVALAFARQPLAKALFADHAEDGIAIHKPDFSWSYLLARDFVAPVVVYERRLLVAAVDAIDRLDWRPPTAEAAAYAIALEALHGLSRAEMIHVRHPLWLTTAAAVARKAEGGKTQAVAAALRRRGIEARVSGRTDDPAIHDVSFQRTTSPKVSIIIPTKNAGDLVEKCIADLRATADYEPYETMVIDHESDEPRLSGYLTRESAAGRLRVFPYRGPFNYAAMNNAAIRQTDGELVLLLNNDVDGFSPGWLGQMVATLEIDERIAAVGALLHYPDGAIQHAGVILTPKRPCIAAHAGLPGDALGYQGRIRSLQEFSAVTAAFMLVRRSAFEQVGGFDEAFPDDYNDIDLCLRLRQAGHKIVYNPQVQASHWESRSRRAKETAKELYLARWRDYFPRDPFYSPHLSMKAFKPDELSALWRERKRVALRAAAERMP